MAPRKRKTRKSRRRPPLGRLLFVGCAFSFLLGLGVLGYLAWAVKGSRAPLYEEAYPAPAGLNRAMGRIDLALYGSLYRENVPVKDVLFRVVEERHQGGAEWEFTLVEVRVPESVRVRDLELAVLKSLSGLGPEIQAKAAHPPSGDSIIELTVLGFRTHRILITRGEKGKAREPEKKPLVAIIIDDIGYDIEVARSFMGMGVPLTLSILPNAPHSTAIARKAREKRLESMLHLPMEPMDYPRVNPGHGALLAGMSDEEIRTAVADHLERVPGVRGVNNHMGSRLTEMEEKMAVVFRELKKRGLFYVDSRTTRRSVAAELGSKLGVDVATRGVFLDNVLSRQSVALQVERLLGLARSSGSAIAIGHPHRETLRYLRESLPKVKESARVVTVAEVLSRGQGEGVGLPR